MKERKPLTLLVSVERYNRDVHGIVYRSISNEEREERNTGLVYNRESYKINDH